MKNCTLVDQDSNIVFEGDDVNDMPRDVIIRFVSGDIVTIQAHDTIQCVGGNRREDMLVRKKKMIQTNSGGEKNV